MTAAQGKGKIAIESDAPLAVAFSPRGEVVAATGFGGGVKLWDARTGALRRTMWMVAGPRRVTCRTLAFSPDGKLLAVGSDDGLVCLWDAETGKERLVLAGHVGDLVALAFAPDGRTLASAAVKYEIKDNRATGRTDGEVRLWDVANGNAKYTWKLTQSHASSLAFSRDGAALASAEGPVRLRSVDTGKVIRTFTPERGSIRAVAFSPDGKQLAGSAAYPVNEIGGGVTVKSEVYLWATASGNLQLKITDLHPWLSCLAISPDGQVLATGGNGPWREDRTGGWISGDVRLWNMQTGALLRSIEQKRRTSSLAFSPDGRMLLTADGAEVAILETATGLRRATLMSVIERRVGK